MTKFTRFDGRTDERVRQRNKNTMRGNSDCNVGSKKEYAQGLRTSTNLT